MSLLIRGGTVVTASDQYRGDVLIEGEKVTAIGTSLTAQADQVIDAAGKYVIPGGIDVHTHLDMPFGGSTSADDFESGTVAAAHGGTTTVVPFACQLQGQSVRAAVEDYHRRAAGKPVIDYAFHLIISDPMVATGASLVKTIHYLREEGRPKEIHIVTAIACTVGIEYIIREDPTVTIWCGDIDDELTAKGYIVPGLGDAGDLAFGVKVQM